MYASVIIEYSVKKLDKCIKLYNDKIPLPNYYNCNLFGRGRFL